MLAQTLAIGLGFQGLVVLAAWLVAAPALCGADGPPHPANREALRAYALAHEGDPEKGYRQGRLTFRLDGEKLHGRWYLVRMHPRTGERQDPWLLIKADDDLKLDGEKIHLG